MSQITKEVRHDGARVAREATQGKLLDATEVAKIARRRLRAAFPGIVFRVKTSKYSGGSSITVRWTDGPTPCMVRDVIGMLHGSDFDGMTDCRVSRGAAKIDEVDELVRFGNDYIFDQRDLSPAFLTALRRRIERRYGELQGWEFDRQVYRLSERAMFHGGHLVVFKEDL